MFEGTITAAGVSQQPSRSASQADLADRPRERLARFGAPFLSDAELLALVLRAGGRSGDAQDLARVALARFGGIEPLSTTPISALRSIPGLGAAKSASLVAAFELGRRLGRRSLTCGEPIQSAAAVHAHFQSRLAAKRRESFHVLILDGRHRMLGEEEVSVGTLTASLVHPREVFREAIRAAAAALVLIHNHPSGDPRPSAEDRVVTDRLVSAGELIGIRVVDHVIVSEGGYFSFSEAGEPSLGTARSG